MVQYQFFLTGCELGAKQTCSVELRVQDAQVRKKRQYHRGDKTEHSVSKGNPMRNKGSSM